MNYTIIGLGNCGCNITLKFEEKGYESYTINTEKWNRKNHITLKKQKTPEEYEKSVPNLKRFFSKIKSDNVLFVVGGSGIVSGASLTILEQIKEKKVSILYIRPEIELINGTAALQERLTFHVFQEYTRSGIFENIFLISNPEIEKISDGLSVLNYFDSINDLIVWMMDTYISLLDKKPILGVLSEELPTSRIMTFGNVDVDLNEEKLFFPLYNIIEKDYYYVCSEELLGGNKKFHSKIKDRMKEKIKEGVRVSYKIYFSSFEKSYAFCVFKTNKIQ